jgi:hypothetical protein
VNVKVLQADHTWVVLEASIDGVPVVTHRRSINSAALASGYLTLEAEKAALVADVEAAYERWQAVQRALASL